MAQARRKSPAKVKPGKSGGHLASIAMLLAGMVIGSLATILWQGARTTDGDIGAGIRRIVEGVHPSPSADQGKNPAAQKARPSTPFDFDFFTVLPEIEVVAPTSEPVTAVDSKKQSGAVGSYLLQAASYRRRTEADRLKATLALNGLVSVIQKVSIQGRGDFYRVRLGPYTTFEAMVEAEQQLTQAGIKALRLKVSKAG